MTDEQEKTKDDGGSGAETAVADQPVDPISEPDELAGDAAWKNFPAQVEAAINYAGANKYDYGPKFRNLELEYTVTSAVPVTDNITRVVLSSKPTTKFRGDSGSEYLDVDLNGDILARRQIRIAKESMPWILMGIATLSLIAAVVLVPVILLVQDDGDPLFVAGRTLWFRATEPKIQPYVTYDAIDHQDVLRKWIIVPESSDTTIAWVNITLINQTSGAVSLSIDTDAVTLTTEGGLAVRPLDIFVDAKVPAEGEVVNPRFNVLELPLWGSVVLESGTQISGFMSFEVPVGSKFSALRWSATDTANIRY